MNSFSIKEAFKRAWSIWKGHKKVLTLMTLCVFVLSVIPTPVESGIGGSVFEIIISLILNFITMGYTKSALMMEEGKKVEFGEIFRHAQYFWRYLITLILFMLLVGVGMVLLIVPGIYFGLKYSFVFSLILDKNLKIGEAFTQSGLLTQGVKWKLFGFYCVSALVMIAGAIALGVGVLVAFPVITLASVVVYRKLLAV